MSVDFRPRSLSAIFWAPGRKTGPLSSGLSAEAALAAEMDLKVAITVNRIVKRRARDMLAGELPLRFCARAAVLVARLRRAQLRREARRAA